MKNVIVLFETLVPQACGIVSEPVLASLVVDQAMLD